MLNGTNNVCLALGIPVVMLCCCPVAADVAAPSLVDGAVITVHNGELMGKELRSYRRTYRSNPEPYTFSVTLREAVKVGPMECWLHDSGLAVATAEGVDGATVRCVQYMRNGSKAELLLDVESNTGRTQPVYYFRRDGRYTNDLSGGEGIGSGALINFERQEGRTWYGVIRGSLFKEGGPFWYFRNAPVTVTLPPEGESFPAPAEEAQSPAGAEETGADTAPPLLTDAMVCEVIGKRLLLMVDNPVNENLVKELYTETVTRLKDGELIKRSSLLKNAREQVKPWPRRGVKLLDVGRKGNRYELIIAFSYSNYDKKEIAGYSKLTLTLDETGKINGMNDDITPEKGSLSPDVSPFEYMGKRDWITVE